jgi:4-amino-4-deoxy-L-arabinose transferase-like glycosyltransferase
MNREISSRTPLYLGLLTLLALLLNTILLTSQPVSHDDFDVALSAINYMESGQLGPTMWNHPCLRNILVYGALRLFGSGVLGVKGVSLLLGTLCTPLVGLVALKIFRDSRVALIAALLWACDALVIDFSRQGINDIYLAFFPLAAIYLAYRFRESGNQGWLLASGIGFGLGLASKWSGLFPLAVTFFLLLVAGHREGGSAGERLARYARLGALLGIVPVLVDLLTFLPWFGRGYSLSEWPALQRAMFLETSQHQGYHPKQWNDTDNRAWKWFVLPSVFVDPFMNMDTPDGNPAGKLPDFEQSVTVELGYANPLVWLLVWPALLLVIRRGIKERDEGCCYLAGLFLAAYLPLVASLRPIWMNTALSVLPYAIMAVAFLVWSVAGRFPKRQLALGLYLGAVLLVASPLYLLAIGKGTKIPWLKEHLVEQYMTQFRKNMPAKAGQGGAPQVAPAPASGPARHAD